MEFLFKHQDIFQLKYMKGSNKHPFLNSFLPAVLSDMKVNYSASGALIQHSMMEHQHI